MPAEVVVDASVAVKWFITEPGWEAARRLADCGAALIAPEFVLVELASVAGKRLRRGDIGRDLALQMVTAAEELFTQLTPLADLTERAFNLSDRHGVSAYDGLYLALAERLEAPLATADLRLAARIEAAGMGRLLLPPDWPAG